MTNTFSLLEAVALWLLLTTESAIASLQFISSGHGFGLHPTAKTIPANHGASSTNFRLQSIPKRKSLRMLEPIEAETSPSSAAPSLSPTEWKPGVGSGSSVPTFPILLSEVTPSSPPSILPSLGARQYIANTTVTLKDTTSVMGESRIAVFEEVGLQLLYDNSPHTESFDVEYLSLEVYGQAFRYPEELHLAETTKIGNLTVYFLVVANLYPGIPEGDDAFEESMDFFFEVHADLFLSRLKADNAWFSPNEVQGTESSAPDEESRLVSFFTTPVIIGLAFTMAFVVLAGAYVIKRMREEYDEAVVGSPGRLGVGPSYDDAELCLQGSNSYEGEVSVDDTQAIFMSFSQASMGISVLPLPGRSTIKDQVGENATSMASVHNSSTTGSHLAGLDIDIPGSDSVGSTIAVRSKSSRSKRARIRSKPRGTPVSKEECDEIRQRERNIFDDADSTGNFESFEEDLSKISTTNQVQFPPSSQRESRARQHKRLLEQKLEESKKRSRVFGKGETDDGSSIALSMQDIIYASTSLEEGFSVAPSKCPTSPGNGDESESYSMLSGEDTVKKEMLALAERIAVEDTPKSQKNGKLIYNRVSDIPGVLLERIDENRAEDDAGSVVVEAEPKVNSFRKAILSNWLRNGATPQRMSMVSAPSGGVGDPESTASNSQREGLGGLRRSLFGSTNRHTNWQQEEKKGLISPNKRYRLSERGHLVPSRLSRRDGQGGEENSAKDENDEPTTPTGNESQVLGITPQKNRPPMLDLNELDLETDDEYDNVETPLVVHPLPSTLNSVRANTGFGSSTWLGNVRGSPSLQTVYGQGMVFGQDPDGFTLSSYYSNARSVQVGGANLARFSDPPPVVTAQRDPPTASTQRRRHTMHTKERKHSKKGNQKLGDHRGHRSHDKSNSQLHKKESNSRNVLELQVENNQDAIILGSMDAESIYNMELEWGNMI